MRMKTKMKKEGNMFLYHLNPGHPTSLPPFLVASADISSSPLSSRVNSCEVTNTRNTPGYHETFTTFYTSGVLIGLLTPGSADDREGYAFCCTSQNQRALVVVRMRRPQAACLCISLLKFICMEW